MAKCLRSEFVEDNMDYYKIYSEYCNSSGEESTEELDRISANVRVTSSDDECVKNTLYRMRSVEPRSPKRQTSATELKSIADMKSWPIHRRSSFCDDELDYYDDFTHPIEISSNRHILYSCRCPECSKKNTSQSPDCSTDEDYINKIETTTEEDCQKSTRRESVSTSFDKASENIGHIHRNKSNENGQAISVTSHHRPYWISDSSNCSEADSSSRKTPSSHIIAEHQPIPAHISLITSIMYDDEKKVIQQVINFDGRINNKTSEGITALIAALIYGRSKEIIEALLDKGAQTDVPSSEKGWTPLMHAVDSCPLDIVELLVRRESRLTQKTSGSTFKAVTDVDEHDITNDAKSGIRVINVETAVDTKSTNNGSTALMLAVEKHRVDIVKFLIDSGANINLTRIDGSTALMLAAERGSCDIVNICINARADVNRARYDGTTALMLAAEKGSSEIVKICINSKADVNRARNDGTTTLMLAAEKGSSEIVKICINSKADVNRARNDGTTALMLAAHERDNCDIVKILIDAGADVNFRRKTAERTALILAAEKNKADVKFRRHIRTATNSNKIDGTTALMLAVEKGNSDIVKICINAGADMNLTRDDGTTALMLAAERANCDMVNVCINAGADVNLAKFNGTTAFMLAIENCSSEIVKLLINARVDVNHARIDGTTALMLAVERDSSEIVNICFNARANVNFERNDGTTALMLAIKNGNRDVVKILIDSGADTNIKKSTDGSTVLMLAIENPILECTYINGLIDVLMYSRVDLDAARNTDGSTALMLAIESARFETAKKLIRSGVDINIKRKSDGKNALALALACGRKDLMKMLKEYKSRKSFLEAQNVHPSKFLDAQVDQDTNTEFNIPINSDNCLDDSKKIVASTLPYIPDMEKHPNEFEQLNNSGYGISSSSSDFTTDLQSSAVKGLESSDLSEINSCIGETEYDEILEAVDIFCDMPDSAITIANLLAEENSVIVRYLIKSVNNERTEQKSAEGQFKGAEHLSFDAITQGTDYSTQSGVMAVQNEAAVTRDLDHLRNRFKEIAPEAEIIMTQLKKMPCFKTTAGLSSRLIHVDKCGVRNRIGQITALLHDSRIAHPNPTDYALTAGHNINVEDQVFISNGNSLQQIGTVMAKVEDNGTTKAYVDAALIKLNDETIKDLQLTQRFKIDQNLYRLSQSELELPQQGRVVLRAVDQTEHDEKGIISQVRLSIPCDQNGRTRKYRLVQLKRYSEDGNHRDNIHTEGDSGLLTTYEPSPGTGDIVKPVIMLIGLYPQFDENGNELYSTSVGIDLRRVLARMSTEIDKQLQLFQDVA